MEKIIVDKNALESILEALNEYRIENRDDSPLPNLRFVPLTFDEGCENAPIEDCLLNKCPKNATLRAEVKRLREECEGRSEDYQSIGKEHRALQIENGRLREALAVCQKIKKGEPK